MVGKYDITVLITCLWRGERFGCKVLLRVSFLASCLSSRRPFFSKGVGETFNFFVVVLVIGTIVSPSSPSVSEELSDVVDPSASSNSRKRSYLQLV
jgi:hypothetical protein